MGQRLRMQSSKKAAIGLIMAGVLVFTVCAAILITTQTARSSDSSEREPSETVGSALSGGGAVFIGDSYISGDGAPGRRGLAILASNELGLAPTVSSDPQSGYTRAGVRGFTTGELVEEAPERLGAQIVVLASGYSDVLGSPPDSTRLRDAARRAISAAADKWPRARVVVLGPWTPTGDATVNQNAVNGALRDVAAEQDVAFIDTLSPPLVTAEMIGADKVNPSPAGHRAIATELAKRITAVA